jgi:hypothetical protein
LTGSLNVSVVTGGSICLGAYLFFHLLPCSFVRFQASSCVRYDCAVERACFVLLALVAVAACEKGKCGGPFEPGTTYEVTAIEPLSASGMFPGAPLYNTGLPSCQARDGFERGRAIRLRADGWIEGRHCEYPVARVEGYAGGERLADAELNRFFSDIGPAIPFYVAGTRVQAGSCAMNVAFGLERAIDPTSALPSSDSFAAPQPGKTPPAALHRYLWSPMHADGCADCGDVFAASVKPL